MSEQAPEGPEGSDEPAQPAGDAFIDQYYTQALVSEEYKSLEPPDNNRYR